MRAFFQTITLLIFFFYFISGCQKIKPEPPERSTLDSMMQVPNSVLNIPIEYDIQNLQDWLNKKIYGTFVNQSLNLDEKDSIYLSVKKIAPIRMWWIKGVLWYELPIELSVSYFRKLGRFTLNHPEPVVTQIVLKLNSEVSLDENWNLITKSKLHDIEWRKEPNLRLGKININLRKPVDKALKERQDSLVYHLDQATYEHLDIKKVIDKLWNDLQKPLLIHKNEPQVFLKNRASIVEGNIRTNNTKKIILDLTLHTQAAIALEERFLPPTNPDVPLFVQKLDDHDEFDIFIHAIVTYDKINKEAKKFLKGQEVEVRGYKAIFKDIEVYGSGQKLVVKLETKGDLKGQLFILGEVVYEPESRKFIISNFKYDIDTEDQLIKTAHSFLKERILVEVQQYLSFDVGPFLDELPEKIASAIDEGKSGDALDLTLDQLTVKSWNSLITANDIQIMVNATGKAKIELKELKKGKSVKIGNLAQNTK